MEADFLKTLKSNRSHHAYLVDSTDDGLIAKILAALVVDASEAQIIDDLKIETIRQAKQSLYKKPLVGKRKALIIKAAHQLALPAQNSLLKVLEEPPSYATIFLLTEKTDLIIPTIKSRVQLVTIKKNQPTVDFKAIEKLRQDSLLERFKFAALAVEKADLDSLLDSWLTYFHQQLLAGQDVNRQIEKIKQGKIRLNTNASKRLVLENILVDF